MVLRSCAVLLLCLWPAVAQQPAAAVLGIPLFLQRNDTNLAVATVGGIDTAGRDVYALEQPSAVAVAILVEAGYELYVNSQIKWDLALTGELRGVAPASSRSGYPPLSSVYVSNHLVQRVGKAQARKRPGGLDITLHFQGASRSSYDAACELLVVPRPVVCTPADVAVYVSTLRDMGMSFVRRIDAVYVSLPAGAGTRPLSDRMGQEMTRLGLGMSYTVPALTRAAAPVVPLSPAGASAERTSP